MSRIIKFSLIGGIFQSPTAVPQGVPIYRSLAGINITGIFSRQDIVFHRPLFSGNAAGSGIQVVRLYYVSRADHDLQGIFCILQKNTSSAGSIPHFCYFRAICSVSHLKIEFSVTIQVVAPLSFSQLRHHRTKPLFTCQCLYCLSYGIVLCQTRRQCLCCLLKLWLFFHQVYSKSLQQLKSLRIVVETVRLFQQVSLFPHAATFVIILCQYQIFLSGQFALAVLSLQIDNLRFQRGQHGLGFQCSSSPFLLSAAIAAAGKHHCRSGKHPCRQDRYFLVSVLPLIHKFITLLILY